MAPAILTQGKTKIRDALKTLITHVGVTDDNTAFAVGQGSLNPAGGVTTVLIKPSTETNVDAATFDATITISGDTEFTNKTIWAVGVLDGAATGNAITRTVRTQGIGVQAGDNYTIGVRAAVEDNS